MTSIAAMPTYGKKQEVKVILWSLTQDFHILTVLMSQKSLGQL